MIYTVTGVYVRVFYGNGPGNWVEINWGYVEDGIRVITDFKVLKPQKLVNCGGCSLVN